MSNSTQYTRTDKAIQSALMLLVERKPFEKITVQDILDETPVSRATFYKHYHDKYEIVEQMQAEFLSLQKAVIQTITGDRPPMPPALLKSSSIRYRQMMQCLLQVQTEKVNLTDALIHEMEKYYLQNASGPWKDLEATVYGSILTSLQIASLQKNTDNVDVQKISLNVLLEILGLREDRQTRQYLEAQLRQNHT